MRNLIPLVIIFVGFVAALTVYLLFSGVLHIPTASAEPVKMSSIDIAKSSLKFLQSMKRSDGRYDYEVGCTDANGCVKTGESYVQTGAWAVLAYGGLYQATGNPQYLQQMNKEVSDLMNSCNGNEDQCLWVLVQMIRAYNITNNPDYLSFARQLGNQLIGDSTNTAAMMTGVEARQFALLYEVTGDQKYLNEARARLAKSKVAWDVNVDSFNGPAYTVGSFSIPTYSCWTELAELEIARVSNDQQALSNVENFFNSANIANNYENLNYETAIQPCINALLIIYKQTGNSQYLTQARSGLQYLITYRWDSPLGIAKKYNGDGGYLFERFNGNNLKTTTDTGYMIYLLSQMPQEKFEILRWN